MGGIIAAFVSGSRVQLGASSETKTEQIIRRKSGLAVILLLVELARSCSLFVNLKARGERKEVKRGEGEKKKVGLIPA